MIHRDNTKERLGGRKGLKERERGEGMKKRERKKEGESEIETERESESEMYAIPGSTKIKS